MKANAPEKKYIRYLRGEDGVFAAYSTRAGGVPSYPYSNPDVFAGLRVTDRLFVWPNQIHKTGIAVVNDALIGAAVRNGKLSGEDAASRIRAAEEAEAAGKRGEDPLFEPFLLEKDGLTGIRIPLTDGVVTDRTDVVLTSIHADCLAVYVYDPVHHAAGLCHAGWKGTLGNIAVRTLETMTEAYGTDPKDVRCAISAGIDQCCFQVGEEVVLAFRAAYPYTDEYATADAEGASNCHACGDMERLAAELRAKRLGEAERPAFETPRYHMNLKGINKRQLTGAGVPSGAIEVDSHCTCCEPKLFWSYRREKGCRERQGAILFLRDK